MSIALRDALARFTVPELKDLVSYLPGAETAGRKDEVIERIVAGMLGPGLEAIWSGLDETQQAAVAEAVHHPLGEYSEQRFRAKYPRVPSFQVAGAKSHGYSGSKSSALGLFIHYSRDERCHFVPADLGTRLKAFVPAPAPLGLKNSETLADDEGLPMGLTGRAACRKVVVMLRTVGQGRIPVSEKTALPGTAA